MRDDTKFLRSLILLGCCAAACSGGADDGSTTRPGGGSGVTTVPAGDGTTGAPIGDEPTSTTADATASGALSDPGTDTDVDLETGFGTDTGAGATSWPGESGFDGFGCKQVDFLFVIDNSQTMEDEQAALAAAFPKFIATIQTTLTTAEDYHIIVVDTDATTRCTADECAGNNPHDTCNNYACQTDQFDVCDNVLGAGVIHPAGVEASNTLCKPYGSPRWLTHDDAALTDRFACMARVGTAGAPNERPLDAMVAALQPDINGAGGCNEGFLRDDAILVVTFFSDDPNVEDSHTAAQAHAAVLAAKGGDATKVSVLGLIPMQPGCHPNDKPLAGAHWLEFINLFGERGQAAPICAADFDQFFGQAIGIIEQSCALQPPG
jgi:hypothetical protein